MPRLRPPYPPEFREQIIGLVRAGRTAEELAEEYEPSAQAIRNWLTQADRDTGARKGGLTTEEKEQLRRLRREAKVLRQEKEILKKAQPGSLGRATRFRIGIRVREDESGRFSGHADVPSAGTLPQRLLAWLKRPPSARSQANSELAARMKQIHRFSRDTYGRPRMYAEHRSEGEVVNHKRVGRLMREEGLVGATRRQKWRTTVRDKDARPAPDLVSRNFVAAAPDQLWAADITYVPTGSGFLYLSVVVDAWSRRVVGWSIRRT
jgi:transposase-like protein